MSYTKQNFQDGQVLTADHMNAIETGIENAFEAIPTEEEIAAIVESNIPDSVATDEEVTNAVSEAVNALDIPTDEEIDSKINAALGVIENGSY